MQQIRQNDRKRIEYSKIASKSYKQQHIVSISEEFWDSFHKVLSLDASGLWRWGGGFAWLEEHVWDVADCCEDGLDEHEIEG